MSCFFTVVSIVVCNRPYILTSSIIGLLPLELLWSSSPIPLVVHGVFNPNTNKKNQTIITSRGHDTSCTWSFHQKISSLMGVWVTFILSVATHRHYASYLWKVDNKSYIDITTPVQVILENLDGFTFGENISWSLFNSGALMLQINGNKCYN